MQLSCHDCALRACGLFKPVTPEELGSINRIKREHLLVPAGAEIIRAERVGQYFDEEIALRPLI
jgi:hypothetical protein